MVEFLDGFTGAADTLVTSRASDTGGTLATAPTSSSGYGNESGSGIELNGSGRARGTNGDIGKVISPTDATSADAIASCEFNFPNSQNANDWCGLWFRHASAANTGYFVRFYRSENSLKLFRVSSNTPTQLGSSVGGMTDNETYRWTVKPVSTLIDVYIQKSNNEWLTSAGSWSSTEQACISHNDNGGSGITTAGRIGLTLRATDATCATADNLQYEVVGGAAAASLLAAVIGLRRRIQTLIARF